MKTSCITHPEKEPLIIIRKWQIKFCENNRCAAALLSFFEYWHNIKLEIKEKNERTNKIAKQHGDNSTQDVTLSQFHSQNDLTEGILGLYSKDKIIASLQILQSKGVISIFKNPNPKYKFDKTNFFTFYPEVIHDWLKTDDACRKTDNDQLKPDNGYRKTDAHNKVTEIPTETTTESNPLNTPLEKKEVSTDNNSTSPKKEKLKVCSRIIEYLNKATKKRFGQIQSNYSPILTRLNEQGVNYTEQDFIKVIDNKLNDPWFKKDNFQYMNPRTLFGTKFDIYLSGATAGGQTIKTFEDIPAGKKALYKKRAMLSLQAEGNIEGLQALKVVQSRAVQLYKLDILVEQEASR